MIKFHSTIESPLSVKRVMPPTTTIPKVMALIVIIHQPTMGLTTISGAATAAAVVDVEEAAVAVDWKRDLIRLRVCVDRRIVPEEEAEI